MMNNSVNFGNPCINNVNSKNTKIENMSSKRNIILLNFYFLFVKCTLVLHKTMNNIYMLICLPLYLSTDQYIN